jgi:hypothetical protein
VVLSAAEIKAIASGNPKVMRKVQLDAELVKLESLRSSHRDTQARMRRKLQDIAWGRERVAARHALLVAAQAPVAQHAEKEFTAAIVKGAMTTEAVAYTKREAAGKALRSIAAEVMTQAELSGQKLTRTIGAYSGLLLCAQAHPRSAFPEVFLALEQGDTVEPIYGNPIKIETDIGVFASVDSQIRGIPEAIGRIDADSAAKDQEEAQIHAALAQPWDQAERYAALEAELHALNTELSKTTDSPAQATEGTTQERPAELGRGGGLEIVAVSDADAGELEMDVGRRMRCPPGECFRHSPSRSRPTWRRWKRRW